MVTSGKLGSAAAAWLGLCPCVFVRTLGKSSSTGQPGGIPVMPRQWAELFSFPLRPSISIKTLYCIDRTKGKAGGVSCPHPVDRQPFLAVQENQWIRGKEKKSVGLSAVWSQAGLSVGRTDAGPNCTASCQFTSRLYPGVCRRNYYCWDH